MKRLIYVGLSVPLKETAPSVLREMSFSAVDSRRAFQPCMVHSVIVAPTVSNKVSVKATHALGTETPRPLDHFTVHHVKEGWVLLEMPLKLQRL